MSKQFPFLNVPLYALALSVLSVALLTACPTGTKTTVELGVHVSAENCQEASGISVAPESVVLDCADVGGEAKVRIEFPRAAWALAILPPKADGGMDAAARAPVYLSLEGGRCKESIRDNQASDGAILDCAASDGTLVVLTLARQEWRAIKSRRVPAPYDAGPGK